MDPEQLKIEAQKFLHERGMLAIDDEGFPMREDYEGEMDTALLVAFGTYILSKMKPSATGPYADLLGHQPFRLEESEKREGYFNKVLTREGTVCMLIQSNPMRFDYGRKFGDAVVEALNNHPSGTFPMGTTKVIVDQAQQEAVIQSFRIASLPRHNDGGRSLAIEGFLSGVHFAIDQLKVRISAKFGTGANIEK